MKEETKKNQYLDVKTERYIYHRFTTFTTSSAIVCVCVCVWERVFQVTVFFALSRVCSVFIPTVLDTYRIYIFPACFYRHFVLCRVFSYTVASRVILSPDLGRRFVSPVEWFAFVAKTWRTCVNTAPPLTSSVIYTEEEEEEFNKKLPTVLPSTRKKSR